MDIKIETITPEKASAMLVGNVDNRPVRPSHVANIARDMMAGSWALNGDAIRFNGDGLLIDGQHRLQACVKADTSFTSVVIRGIDKSVRLTIDAGSKRSAGDQLTLSGVKSGTRAAAMCRYAMILRDQKVSLKTYTNSEVINFYDSNPGIAESLNKLYKSPRGLSGMTGAVHFISTVIAPDVAEEFADSWNYGSGDIGNPVLVCRERLINNIMAGHAMRTRYKLQLIAYSLQKLIAGEKVKLLKLPANVRLPGWSS